MLQKINKSADFLRAFLHKKPFVGIILGTGLGGFEKEIQIYHTISYEDIPHFPASTVDGHQGLLIMGFIGNISVIVLQGRCHYYEGYSMQEIVFPVRVLKQLGIEFLFLTNASGGMKPDMKVGDIMVITDHINCMPNPLIGPHIPEFGPRFPDMSDVYDKTLVKWVDEIAVLHKIKLYQGCYVAVTGPSYETPKEYEYYRKMGGDSIGMSTIPEVITAIQMNIKCFALSVITDLGIPGKIRPITHEEVKQAATSAEWKISLLLKELIKRFDLCDIA